MRPFVERLEKTYSDQIDFHILNIDYLSNRDMVTQYRVTGIPMIVLLDANGAIFRTLLGYQTDEQLLSAVEALIANQ